MRLRIIVLRLGPALLLQPMRPKWRGTTSADSIAGSYMTSVRPSGVKPLKLNVPPLGSCSSHILKTSYQLETGLPIYHLTSLLITKLVV